MKRGGEFRYATKGLLLVVVGVEEVVCLLGTGLAKEFLVEGLDVGILVGHAERLVRIFVIESLHALL